MFLNTNIVENLLLEKYQPLNYREKWIIFFQKTSSQTVQVEQLNATTKNCKITIENFIFRLVTSQKNTEPISEISR